jgi:hypothetical protein
MEDIEVSRLAVNVGTGAQFKSMLTADPYGSYTLTANIDMAGAELHVAAFYGTLNGGGFTIKNVTQRLSSSSGNAGIFGELRGTVTNLKLSGVDFKALSAGGLASKCIGATVQDVSVQGKVEAGGSAGGVCGSLNGGRFTRASATTVTVTSTSGHAGGLIGSTSIGRSGLGPNVASSSVGSTTVTGVKASGGLIGYCQDAIISRAAVDASVSGQATAGGICGEMKGGNISYSYAKGSSVASSAGPAGGLVGTAGIGMLTVPTDRIQIMSAYAQYTNVNAATAAGGLLGTGQDPFLMDVYAVGNVAGTGAVGGLIGRAESDTHGWTLNNGVYRGVVNDTTRNWAGVMGVADLELDPAPRWALTLFDSTLDNGPYLISLDRQKGATTTALKTPITSNGEVYCWNAPGSTVCGDSAFPSDKWNAGTDQQHHALVNMPGGLSAQPR